MENTFEPGDLVFKQATKTQAFIEGSNGWENWNFEKGEKLAARIKKQDKTTVYASREMAGASILFQIPFDAVIIVPDAAAVCWRSFQHMHEDWDEGPHADLFIEAYDFWKSEDGQLLKELELKN